MVKLKEFIQIENLNEIQQEIRELNNELLSAMNQTTVIRDLFAEKNDLMKQAREISSMLIPEVRELNSFVAGDQLPGVEPIPELKAPRAVRRGRPRKPRAIVAPKLPRELAAVLPKQVKRRGRPRKTKAQAHRKRGRPRKEKIEVSERINPLEELRKNLARLRDE